MHTRDALGRITTLDREDGIYALYSGGGLRQSFTFTSKGELETAQTSQFGSPGVPMPGRSLGFALLSLQSPGVSRQWRSDKAEFVQLDRGFTRSKDPRSCESAA